MAALLPASASVAAPTGDDNRADGASPDEDAFRRLLGCAVHECDARLDIDKHCQLLRQADITQLFPVSCLDSAIRKELRAGGKANLGPGRMVRDYTALSGELAAFWGSTGPYTLAEIYSCFGFGDKLNAIKIRADQVMFSTIRSPGAGLLLRKPKEDHADMGIWSQRLPPPDLHAEAADEDALQQHLAWWQPTSTARLHRFLRSGASLLATDASGQTPLHVLCESAVSDVRFAAAEPCPSASLSPSGGTGIPSAATAPLELTDADAPVGATPIADAPAEQQALAVAACPPSAEGAGEGEAADDCAVVPVPEDGGAADGCTVVAVPEDAAVAGEDLQGGENPAESGAEAIALAEAAEDAEGADLESSGVAPHDSSAIALAMLKDRDSLDDKAIEDLFSAFSAAQHDPFEEFCANMRLLGQEGEAAMVDARYAELVDWCCREAPLSVLAEDADGRTPLCILTGAAGAEGCQAPSSGHLVPTQTLRALCAGLEPCFSACPAQLLHVMRHSESFRDAVEASATALRSAGGDPVPAPLLRALEWIEVAMGGAWEVAEDEWRYGQQALYEGTCPDVEELINSAIRLKRICEQIEKKTSEWRAEEVALKLCEFKSRSAQKARQYEDRIAKLEAEIEQRAQSLQKGATLSVHSLESTNAGSSPKDDKASVTSTDEHEAKAALGNGTQDAAAAQRKLATSPDVPGSPEEAREVVQAVRRQRLVDCDLSGADDDVKRGLSTMRRSLCAAVERLATDLYADQCHCFWELIQNADDNKYAEDVAIPSLDIQLCVDDELGAYVLTVNNELGLRNSDVHAICDVNASLKGIGQTGHKGIGWKSVFRVSDCPHVLSRHFSFKFHVDGPLGKLAYVTPTALTDEEHARLPAAVRGAQDAGCTVMFLPLRCTQDAAAVEAELRQIAEQHLCLVFLRRLHKITLGFPDGTQTRLERKKAMYAALHFPDAPTAGVKISSIAADGAELRHYMPEFVLHNHRVILPSGESLGDLTLAFPSQGASGEGEEEAPLQPLFTFLPVRVLGFRFAIQGPFDLTADRSNLHGKSARNRALCTAVPKAFVGALRAVPQLRASALALFGQETPEAMWLAIRGQMLDALHDVECIPTEPDGTLAAPDVCLLWPEAPRAAEAAQQLPHEVLWACCRRRIVRPAWAAKHRVQLQRMGVTELGLDQWLAVLRGEPAACADGEEGRAGESAPPGLVQQAVEKGDTGLFRRVFALLGDILLETPKVLEQLQDLPLLPGCGRRVLRLADGPVFSRFSAELLQPWQNALVDVGAIRVLDPTVWAVLDAPGQTFLEIAGIVKPTVADILALAAEWHLHVSRQAARSAKAAAALRLAKAKEEEEREAAEMKAKAGQRCPVGHALARCSSASPWVCDHCGRRSHASSMQRFRCEECNYDRCGECRGVDGQAGPPVEPASSSTSSAARGFSGALAERITASPDAASTANQWDRELLVGKDVGPLGLRFSASSSVVSEVESGSWAEGQGMQPGDELIALGGAPLASLDHQQLRRALGPRPLKLVVRPRRYAQHRKVDLRLEWPEETEAAPADSAAAKEAAAAVAASAAAKAEARRQRPRGFWDSEGEVARKLAEAKRLRASVAAADAAEKAPQEGEAATEQAGAKEASAEEASAEEADAEAANDEAVASPQDGQEAALGSAPIPRVPKAYPAVTLSATVSALWASLACMRSRFFNGDGGVVVPSCGRELSWAELGDEGLVVPTGSARRGFGPVRRLTCPTYLGQTAGGELTQDVLVTILRFLHGTLAATQDSGVLADVPPSAIGTPSADTQGSAVVALPTGGEGREPPKKAEDLLEWETFFDGLGMRQLLPCSRTQQVAGTVLTIDLGFRLSSAAWWRRAARSAEAFSYLCRRLEVADRVELCWLRSLRAHGGVDVSQLFLRGPFLRYGGSFLPYLDLHDPSDGMRACLQRLGIATTVAGKSLRECLRVLEKSGNCFDVGVYADIYAALHRLPEHEQESSVTGEFGRPLGPFPIFTPPRAFSVPQDCVWADGGQSTLRWLARLTALQPAYLRYGADCRDWLLGPRCGVPVDLNTIGFERFLVAIRRLVEKADVARHLPLERLHQRLDGEDSPTAHTLLEELQKVAVQAYRHLANWCADHVEREQRQLARGTISMAFQQEALIIMTHKEWLKPKRVRAHEAYWEVAPDLAGTKAERLAMRNHYDAKDHEALHWLFVTVVGIPETLTREDLQARLRVPFGNQPEALTAWQQGFSLNDFEQIRSVRQGPSVLPEDSSVFEDLSQEEMRTANIPPRVVSGGGVAPQGGAPWEEPLAARDVAIGDGAGAGEGARHGATNGVGSAGGSAAPPVDPPAPEQPEDADGARELPEEAITGAGAGQEGGGAVAEGSGAAAEGGGAAVEGGSAGEGSAEAFGGGSAAPAEPASGAATESALEGAGASADQEPRAAGGEASEPPRGSRPAAGDADRETDASGAGHQSHAGTEGSQRGADPPSPRPEPASSSRERRGGGSGGRGGDDRSSDGPHGSRGSGSGGASGSGGHDTTAGGGSAGLGAAGGAAGADAGSRQRRRKGGGERVRVRKQDYERLLRQLREAEERLETWNKEVEAARAQLQNAEMRRDRYLKILKDCYERDYAQQAAQSNGSDPSASGISGV